jgi:hypothetical protein
MRAGAYHAGLTPDTRTEVVEYLKEMRYSGLVKDRKYTMLPSMQEMAYVLDALSDLSAINEINKDNVYWFIDLSIFLRTADSAPSRAWARRRRQRIRLSRVWLNLEN